MDTKAAGTSSVRTGAEEHAGVLSRFGKFARWLQQPSVLLWGGLLLIAALYIRTTAFGFVYDDHYIPTSAPLDSWKVVFDLFRHDIFGTQGNVRSVYYRPLSSLGVLVFRQLTGGSPAWFHLITLALHLYLVYLAYALGRLLFGSAKLAALAAVLFGIHPGKIETIAWISGGLCDGVGALFFFGALICYLKWQQSRTNTPTLRSAQDGAPAQSGTSFWLIASLLCFAGALFTKETLFFALILIAIHYWWTGSPNKRLLKTGALAAPYLAVFAAYMFCRRLALQGPVENTGNIRPGLNMECLWNAPAVVWWYVQHLVWPWQLGVFYDYSNVSGPALLQFVLPLLGLIAAAILGTWLWYRNRSANLTILYVWFVLALAAYVAFSPMVRLHDRYLHLASYPFCVLVAWLILKAGGASEKRIVLRSSGILLVLMLWAGVTWSQSAYWRNDTTLWAHATKTAPGMVEPWLHVAEEYSGDLQSMRAVQVIDEGLKHRPKSPSLWQMRGLLLYDRAQYEAARLSFLKVVEVSAPYNLREFPDVLRAKTGALYYLGLTYMNAGDFSSAERWLREAVALRPEVAELQKALADAQKAGKEDAATMGHSSSTGPRR